MSQTDREQFQIRPAPDQERQLDFDGVLPPVGAGVVACGWEAVDQLPCELGVHLLDAQRSLPPFVGRNRHLSTDPGVVGPENNDLRGTIRCAKSRPATPPRIDIAGVGEIQARRS